MSSDNNNPNDNSANNNNNNNNNANNDMARQPRRSSVASNTFANLWRSNSTSQGTGFPGPITTAAMNDQRRRLSITTLGLSGSAPASASAPFRRSSLSTNNSDSVDESAIEEDDSIRTAPTTPFTRRMSFGAQAAMRSMRTPATATNGRPSPPPSGRRNTLYGMPPTPSSPPPPTSPNKTWGRASLYHQASSAQDPRSASDMARTDQGFNWSEQLRSRAENSVSGGRSSFSFASGLGASPPRAGNQPGGVAGGSGNGSGSPPAAYHHHDRAKSVSDMPVPPSQPPAARQPQKPDHFQERILKGDFYMD